MSTQEKLKLYKERLQNWRGRCIMCPEDLSHRNLSKPNPADFGLTDNQEQFMATKIHDEVMAL